MVIAKVKGIFSKSVQLFRDDEHIADISISSLKEKASFRYQDREYSITKESAFKSNFSMTLNGVPLANGKKLSVWKYDTLVTVSSQEFLIKRSNWWNKNTDIFYSGRKIGAIKPKSVWSRDAILDVPVTIPIEVQIFMLLITIFYWQRDQAATSG